jgi:hypothetical protein
MSDKLRALLFTKSLGNNNYQENAVSNTTINYKKDIFSNKKTFLAGSNVYTIGTYSGVTDISVNGFINSPTTIQGCLVKTDYLGNIIWAKTIGTSNYQTFIYQVDVIETSGNYQGIYICGKYASSSITQYNNIKLIDTSGVQSGFIAKYDLDGNFIWSNIIKPTAGGCQTTCVSVSNAGIFFGTMIKNISTITTLYANDISGVLETNITGRATNRGNYDICVRGIDHNNTIIFKKTMFVSTSGNSNNYIRDMKCGADGLYILYELYDATSVYLNVYSEKYAYNTINTAALWTKKVTTSSNDYGNALLVTDDNVIIVGAQSIGSGTRITQDVDISNSFNTTSAYAALKGQGFIICRSLNGAFRWAKQIMLTYNSTGIGGNEYITGITTNGKSLYVIGEVESIPQGSILSENNGSTLAPLITYNNVTTSTTSFILKYDMSGQYIWGKPLTDIEPTNTYSIFANSNYLGLYYSTTTNAYISLYNDVEELPLYLNASDGDNLGEVILNIVNENDGSFQLQINSGSFIDLSGYNVTYTHTNAINGANSYNLKYFLTENLITFTPRSPTITAVLGNTLGTIDINVNAYNANYDIYRYDISNSTPQLIASDISNSVYTDAVSDIIQYYYYIVAKTSNGAEYTSNTVNITPKTISFTLQQGASLGTILINIDNYNANYTLYRVDSNDNIPIKIIDNSSNTVFTDKVTSIKSHSYYITLVSPFNGSIYTTSALSIIPRTMVLSGSVGSQIGIINLSIVNYNAGYIIYRNTNGFDQIVGNNIYKDPTYQDIYAEDKINTYYILATVNGVIFKSNSINIRPIQLSVSLAMKDINNYSYTCGNYNIAYNIHDADTDKILSTFTNNTFGMCIENISFYASSTSSGNRTFKSNIVNITDGTLPLALSYSQPIASISTDVGFIGSTKRIYIGNYIYNCGSYFGDITSNLVDKGMLNNVTKTYGFIYISDSTGNIIKGISIGNASYNTYIYQIDVIETGNNTGIYVCGRYQKNVNTAYTSISLPNTVSSGGAVVYAGFIAKYNLDLEHQWSRTVNSDTNNLISCIAINNEEVHVGCNIRPSSDNTVKMFTESGELMHTVTDIYNTQYNAVYMFKLNLSGDLISQSDYIINASQNINNSIYDLCYSGDSVYSIMGIGSSGTSLDLYIMSLNTVSYDVNWSKNIISYGNDIGLTITLNASSLFVSGYFTGNIQDPDTFDILSATNTNNAFIIKLDKVTGDIGWIKRLNSTNDANGVPTNNNIEYITSSYCTDSHLYVIGYLPLTNNYLFEFYKNSEGNISIRKLLDINLNSGSIFIIKYDMGGNIIYATQYDTRSSDTAYSIYVKNGYIAMCFNSNLNGGFYRLYKEELPAIITIADGNVLGTIDINMHSEYNFMYSLYINESDLILLNDFKTSYTYLSAKQGINRITVICITSDQLLVKYDIDFNVRSPTITLSNDTKNKITIIPQLYESIYYNIQRSLDGDIYNIIKKNAFGNYIDPVIYGNTYYYTIYTKAPYSNETFYSNTASLTATELNTLDTPIAKQLLSLSNIDSIMQFPNKKLYINETSIYSTGTYTSLGDIQDISLASFIDPSPITSQGYIIKMNLDGDVNWAINIGNDTYDTVINQMSICEWGEYTGIYVCGQYASNDASEYNNIKLVNTNNVPSGFLAKYDMCGAFVWAYSLIPDQFDSQISCITVTTSGIYIGACIKAVNTLYTIDASGIVSAVQENIIGISEISERYNIWIKGLTRSFEQTITSFINFDNYIRDIVLVGNNLYVLYDLCVTFMQKLNTYYEKYDVISGQSVWIKTITSGYNDYGYSLIYNNGNIIVCGIASSSGQEPPTADDDITNIFSYSSPGAAYIVSRNLNGDLNWAKQLNIVDSFGQDILINEPSYSLASIGNSVYIAGVIHTTDNIINYSLTETYVDADQNILTKNLLTINANTSGTVGYLLKYGLDGSFKWGKIIDNLEDDMIPSIYSYNGYIVVYNIKNSSTVNLLIYRDTEEVYIDYTVVSNDIIIPPNNANSHVVPCLVKGTTIKTRRGDVLIENLQQLDEIIQKNGRSVPIKAIYSTKLITNEQNAPYHLPAKVFGSLPVKDIILSPKHAIQITKDVWQIPEFASTKYKSIKKTMIGQEVHYYHIELPNYFTDNIIANGSVVESFANKQVNKTKTLYKYNNKTNGFIRSY